MDVGKYIAVETKKGEKFEGMVIKSVKTNLLTLKLDSGYNINIDRKNITKTMELKMKKSKKTRSGGEKIEFKPGLKNISILHTGGTIASRVSYETGAVSPSFSPSDLISMFPEIKGIANIKSRLVANMFSEDMRFGHYNLLAKEIEKEIKNGADGIVVSHGTDTMAFTACALSFALEGLNKPVILVGAQRSSDRPSSDAAINLLCTINFVAKSEFNRVAICMHSRSGDDYCEILPACRVKKLHTSRRDAFRAVNGNPIARISKEGNVELFQTFSKSSEQLRLRLFKENIRVGILKAHPNLFSDELKAYNKFDGLLIEGTGLGHLSINMVDRLSKENDAGYNELKKLAKKIPVVMVSQCIFGRVNMNVYSTGRKLQDIGVLGNFNDMTLEAAFIKLAWLLSNYKNRKDIERLIAKDLRGEISKRVIFEESFI